jgi:hypothetical protein
VQQLALDGLVLPVDDHGLAALAAAQGEVKNRIVAGLRVQNPLHMSRIYGDGKRFLARSIHYGRNLSFLAHAAGKVLGAGLSRLRFQYVLFQYSRHKFQVLSEKFCRLAAFLSE